MSSLLFPLSLLLLALCRSISSEAIMWSYAYPPLYHSNSSVSIPREKMAGEIEKFVLGITDLRQFAHLNLHLGNTIYAMSWNWLGLYTTLPSYYKSALDNGVLCEVNDQLNETTIKKIQYNSDVLTTEQREKEVEVAKDLRIHIHCDVPSPDPCFCTEKKILLYCAALKFKAIIEEAGVSKTTCEKELMGPLFNGEHARDLSGPVEIVLSIYTDDHHHRTFVKHFTGSNLYYDNYKGAQRTAQFYCKITNPAAEKATKTLFAANALRWTLEGFIMNAVLGPAHKDLDDACAVESFKTSEVGKCACSKDKGIAFCIYKARAEYFKRQGYISCNNEANELHKDKKPTHLPPFKCLIDSFAAASAECDESLPNQPLSTDKPLA